jgi:alpha-tubulin suppressor-like RCC1 family protein
MRWRFTRLRELPPAVGGSHLGLLCFALLLAGMLAGAFTQVAAASGIVFSPGGVRYVANPREAPTNELWTPCAPAVKGHAECELIAAPKPSAVPRLEYQGSGRERGLDPKDLRSAYNLPSTGGSESTIAIVDGPADPDAESDLAVYRKEYGLSACSEANGCFKQLNEHGEPHKPTSVGEWSIEISLDLDMVSAACPECHITLIEAANEETGLLEAQKAAAKLGVTAVSNSWNLGFEANNSDDPSECNRAIKFYCVVQKEEEEDDAYFDQSGTPIFVSGGDYGYAVRYPAVSQYVVSVGGTVLWKATKTSRGWVEKVWSNPAYGKDEKGRGTGSGCSLYEPKPTWQTGKACAKRMETDVAAEADAETSPVSVYDTYAGGWNDVGGTSASSPFVAGVWGLSSSSVRSLGAEAFYRVTNGLFDVTEGNNGTCPSEDALFCTAEIGYDGPTGNGTLDGPLKLPSVTSVAPEVGPEAGGTSVTIAGTQLKGVKAVRFGSTEATSFKVASGTSVKATAPAHAAGTVDVTVTTSEGTSPTTTADRFAYLPKPTVSNVQPNVGAASGGTRVMISGTGFTDVSGVKFGQTKATSFTVISETWISATSPAGSGTVDVTVGTPGGTSATGSADHFTYRSGGVPLGWGANADGELGDGTTTGPETCAGEACSRIPVAASGSLGEVTAVSAGTNHSLALQGAGTVLAWGYNGSGQFGNGTTTNSSSPVKVSSLSGVAVISAGNEFSLAQLKNGTVKAWGYNGSGQLGNGTTTSSDTPVTVSGITEAVAVAAGEAHSLALLKDGTVKAWGQNAAGELGNGTTTSSDTPVAVSGITEAVAISAGSEFSLALLKNGTVVAWGYNGAGQLGDGTTTSSDVPVAVSSLAEVVSVAAGSAHSLALLKGGSVRSWGANQSGQLGDGSCCEKSDVPVKVSELSEATAVAAGFQSVALTRSGTVKDWGRNSDGQLGDGTSTGPETCEPVEEATRACSKIPVTVGTGPSEADNLTEAIGIEGGVNYNLAIGP